MELYNQNFYKLDNEVEESESEDDYLNNLGYKPKRFAKDAHIMRDDIFNMFKEKDKWSWDDIKDRFSD